MKNTNTIITISGINFTQREIDVISCILHNRGAKKISQILNISPRTVENYTQRLLLKISGNSQEDLKDFIEKSEKLEYIKKHYVDLTLGKIFKKQLNEISSKLKNKNVSCIVHYTKNEKLDYILKYLVKANVNVSKVDINTKSNKNFGNKDSLQKKFGRPLKKDSDKLSKQVTIKFKSDEILLLQDIYHSKHSNEYSFGNFLRLAIFNQLNIKN